MSRVDRVVARARCAPRPQTYQTGRRGRRRVETNTVATKNGLISRSHRRGGMWWAIRQEQLAELHAVTRLEHTRKNNARKARKEQLRWSSRKFFAGTP